MKKVLIVASSFFHIRSFHLPYIREFRRLGWLVHVAAGGEPCREVREAADLALSLPVEKSYFSPQNLRACTELRRLIKKQDYSLIITHTTLGAAIARLAVKGLSRRPRTVIVVHGYLFGPGAGLFPSLFLRAAEYFTAKETDRIITMNEWDRNWAERNFPKTERCSIPGIGVEVRRLGSCGMDEKSSCFRPEKTVQGTSARPEDGSSLFAAVSSKTGVSPSDGMPPQKESLLQNGSPAKNGSLPQNDSLPEDEPLPQTPGVSRKHFTLVYPAEFSARKNQAFLIRAMRQLPPGVRLILPGNGALLSECRDLAARLGLSDRVIFPGYVDRIGTILSQADAVVSSSRSEGLPFCIMEAMLCGLPVIASDVKGNRDLVENGSTGFLYIPENTRSFTKAVRNLMKSRKKAARMGRAGLQRAQRFRLEKVLPEVMRAYIDEDAPIAPPQH